MTNRKDPSIQFKIDENIDSNDSRLSYDKSDFDGLLFASDVLQSKSREKFSTGSSLLDEVLGGGIETGSITQFYGGPGSGKSQICFTLCAILPKKYGSIYVDTEGKFRPERIKQILTERDLEFTNALKSIHISKPSNCDEMERFFDQVFDLLKLNPSIKLLIVDSIINHLRIEYQGRSELPARQQKLCLLMSKLQKIAIEKNLAVVITNHIQTNPTSSSYNNTLPLGGNIIKIYSTHIVSLEKYPFETKACLIKSNYLPCNETYFIIANKGIENSQIKK